MVYVIEKFPFRIKEIRTGNGHEFQAKFHWHVEDDGSYLDWNGEDTDVSIFNVREEPEAEEKSSPMVEYREKLEREMRELNVSTRPRGLQRRRNTQHDFNPKTQRQTDVEQDETEANDILTPEIKN